MLHLRLPTRTVSPAVNFGLALSFGLAAPFCFFLSGAAASRDGAIVAVLEFFLGGLMAFGSVMSFCFWLRA